MNRVVVVECVPTDPWKIPADALWLPVGIRAERPCPVLAPPQEARGVVEATLQGFRAGPIPSEPRVLCTWGRWPTQNWICAGIGDQLPPTPMRFEQSIRAAVRVALAREWSSLVIPLPGWYSVEEEISRSVLAAGLSAAASLQALSKSPRRKPLRILLPTEAADRERVRSAAEQARREVDILAEVLALANRDGSRATPQAIAALARRLGAQVGVSVRVYTTRELRRQKCTALLAVGAGSAHLPVLIRLEYRGAAGRPVAWIGKTITFDSGGISIKPSKGMGMMRYDKSGGMAVLAAVLLAAVRRLPARIVGWLPVAENLPDARAYRPGDILETRAGIRVEVVTTDAEGRLILADALSMAAEDQPEVMVDIATLTGACVVALGHHAAAVLGTDEALVHDLQAAGERVGERVWPMPLWAEYDAQLVSDFADVANAGEGGGGLILGASFLRRFVPKEIPWAHLDIAGTAWVEKSSPDRPAGATLFGARLLADWVEHRAPSL